MDDFGGVDVNESRDPVTRQYNDILESALNDAQNALLPWAQRLALSRAERSGTTAGASVGQAEALDFVATTFIDGLTAMPRVSGLEVEVSGIDAAAPPYAG